TAPHPPDALSWLAASSGSKEEPALHLADEFLAGGESSRLYQALVYREQVAQRVTFDADLNEDLGLLTSRLILASGKTPAEAENSFQKQIDDVLKNGVTDAELEKAKTRFLTGKLLERETNNGRASALGEAAVLYGDPNRVNTDLAKLQGVTAERIKSVLNRYLAGSKKVMIEFLLEAMKARTKMTKLK